MRVGDGVGAAPPALELTALRGGYGRGVVIQGVDLQVPPGAVAALLGPNGAGKTTLLRMASGLLKPRDGRVWLGGEDVTTRSAHERALRGLCLIPEGRGIFRVLSVRENLLMYCPPRRPAPGLEQVFEIFPVLGSRAGQVAGSLSGGEQQMLALARAFLSGPAVVMLDEVSMGLAPIVVEEIFSALQLLAEAGIALLLVEQYVSRALGMADLVYLLEQGEIVYAGAPSELDIEAVTKSYLGADVGRVHP